MGVPGTLDNSYNCIIGPKVSFLLAERRYGLRQLIYWLILIAVLFTGAIVLRTRPSCLPDFYEEEGRQMAEIEQLARDGGDESALRIVAILNSDPPKHWKVQVIGISFLGDIGSDKALPFLKRKFLEGPEYLTQPAAGAIGRIGSEDALDFLTENLGSSNDRFFQSACWGLARSGHPSAFSVLEEASRNAPTPERRKCATEDLEVLSKKIAGSKDDMQER